MDAESGASIHAGAVQRKSRVYRPGLTKAQTSSRVSPFAMTVRPTPAAAPTPRRCRAYAVRALFLPEAFAADGCRVRRRRRRGRGHEHGHGRLPLALALHREVNTNVTL